MASAANSRRREWSSKLNAHAPLYRLPEVCDELSTLTIITDQHWDLRALLTLIVRYHEYHKREQLALRELREAEANNKQLDQTNFDLAEALELAQKDVARLQEELVGAEAEWVRYVTPRLVARAPLLIFTSLSARLPFICALCFPTPAEK